MVLQQGLSQATILTGPGPTKLSVALGAECIHRGALWL